MIKFEKHDGMLFRMLDKPVPLTPDAEMPCLVRLIQDDSPMGKYNQSYSEYRYGVRLGCCMLPIIATHIAKNGVVNDIEWDVSRYEIIGYPVVEGSKEWALYQMMQGEWVYNPSLEKHKSDKLDTRYLHAYGKFGQDIVVKNTLTGIDSILGAANISHWTNYAEPSGWQLYKEPESPVDPKERPLRNLILQAKEEGKNIRSFYQNLIFTPNALTDLLANNMFRWWYIGNWELTDEEQNYYPQIKLVSSEPETAKEQFEVGDWVTDGAVVGTVAVINDGRAWVKTKDAQYHLSVEHLRKLAPSQVVITIGCLSGTVAKLPLTGKHRDPLFRLIHGDCKESYIRLHALDTSTRELVESLLEAMQGEK